MQQTSSTLALTLFGAFQARRDGVAITQFRGDKVRALLVYLAVEADRPHSRAHLAGLLWPEQGDDAALANVSKSLVRLRAALGDETGPGSLLLGTRQTIQWNAHGAAQVDVTTFLHLARSTNPELLQQAAALYRGPLLPGFSIPGCPAFDEWLLLTREQCEQAALTTLDRLADMCLARAAYAEAEVAARRLLAIDPWRETAYRHLMHALAGMGDRAGAVAAYERCRQVLLDDLEVEPDEETHALLGQIRAGAIGSDAPRRPLGNPHQSAPAAALPGTIAPLVAVAAGAETDAMASAQDWSEAPDTGVLYGRAAEATQLGQWLLDERCRLVAVLGIGGVGKTALAASVARALAPHFERVIWRSLLNAPPLDELLRPVLQALAGNTLAELPTGLDAQLALLLDGLRRQRCLLVLDNFESLLDADGSGQLRPGYEGYASLLQRLAQTQHASCLLLTSRERPQGLARWEADLAGVRSLPLHGIDAEAGEAILQARGLIGQAADARALVARYGGHPLALKLVAQTVHELFGGTIGDFLREETPIFDDIRTVLDQQVARLSALEQQLLFWLAVEREPTAVAMLRANLVQPQPAGTFVEAVRALQRRSLLERVGDGFTLPNVVIEYLTERLVARVSAELLDAEGSGGAGPAEQRTLLDSFTFLNRFALVKAQAKQYVRESQRRMIMQPVEQRLLAALGTAGLAARVQAILAGLRAAAPLAPGYAGGNLFNLLLQGGIDVSGFDFSRLCVWQADLQGAVAAGVNLAHADLAGSSFTQSIYPQAVMVGPAGQLVVAGSNDNDVCLWRTAQGQLQLAFRLPGQGATSLVFSPDGQFLAVICRDRTIRVWSVASGAQLHILKGHTEFVVSAAFDQTAHLLASTSNGSIRLWDLQSGRCLRILRHPMVRHSWLAFRPERNAGSQGGTLMLASGGDGQAICLWDVERGQLVDVLHAHERRIQCLAFSPDGTLLASGSHDGTILLWDVQNSGHGRLHGMLRGHSHIVDALTFHPDGNLLASGGADGTVRLWDVRSGLQQQLMFSRGNNITHLAFDGDGRVVAGVYNDRAVRLWEVETGRALDTLSGYLDAVPAVRFRPDGCQLATGSGDGRILLWDSQGELAAAFNGHAGWVRALAWSPDGRMLASGSTDETVRLWDVATGRAIGTLRGHQGAVKALTFSPDGRLLVSAGVDRTIHVWSVSEPSALVAKQVGRALHGHTEDVESLAFSADGRLLLSGSLDRTARLWDMDSGEVVHVLAGHTAPLAAAAISPRGDLIATTSYDQTVRLWDVATGASSDRWPSVSAGGRVVAFSPRGDLVAYGSNYIDLTLRDVDSGTVLHTLRGHAGMIMGLDWSPGEPILASSSLDGTVRLWNVSTGSCLYIIQPPGPYAGMNITGATGISDAQRAALQALGAVEAPPYPGNAAQAPGYSYGS